MPTISSEPDPTGSHLQNRLCGIGHNRFGERHGKRARSNPGTAPRADSAETHSPGPMICGSWTQDDRTVYPNEGWWALRPGQATGRIIGGNLGTLNLLQGTGCLPSMERRS